MSAAAQTAPAAQELPCLSCPATTACSSTPVSHTERPVRCGGKKQEVQIGLTAGFGSWAGTGSAGIGCGKEEEPSHSHMKAAAAQAQELEKSPKRNLISAAVLV